MCVEVYAFCGFCFVFGLCFVYLLLVVESEFFYVECLALCVWWGGGAGGGRGICFVFCFWL